MPLPRNTLNRSDCCSCGEDHRLDGSIRARATRALYLLVALGIGVSGCQERTRPTSSEDAPLSAQDSAATDAEVRASLAGEVAPRQQSYSYRGLYAGMARDHLESVSAAKPASCATSASRVAALSCSYDVVIGPDSARAHLDVSYVRESPDGALVAREISIARDLPLNVDGVRLARELSDAFEQQTALLDRRDASYGHHVAHIRMGTLNGTRQNFVELAVAHKAGREVLSLTLSRGAAAATVKPAASGKAQPGRAGSATPGKD